MKGAEQDTERAVSLLLRQGWPGQGQQGRGCQAARPGYLPGGQEGPACPPHGAPTHSAPGFPGAAALLEDEEQVRSPASLRSWPHHHREGEQLHLQELHYSHLILATGSDGPFPGKFNKVIDMESAIQTYEDMVKEIEKSERILVVGGGAAGVEMAAEIKTEYPNKEVTLIHSKIALADVELLASVRQEVKLILLRKGVRLLLSERISNVEDLTTNQFQKDMVVRTEKGTEVVTDMVVMCTGIKINSSAYAAAFGDKMASNGALKVNKHLQLEGYENIYAIGDCADLEEPKMAYHAGLHANIAVTNIINSLTHKPLKTYTPGSLTFLLSMGRNDGVGQVKGYYVGRLLVTIAKSRDLFVSKSWKTMGQTMPS
uniref:Ferroptosis suppressor protein 1 n=1 Tax=Strigops habroptila TaxID=2489341 RepID=A0A672UCT5_STRHB